MPAESLLNGGGAEVEMPMAMDAAMQTGDSKARRNGPQPGFKACDIKGNPVALFVAAKPAPRRKPRGGAEASLAVTEPARREFLDELMRGGDPAVAADRSGLSLVRLVELRDTDAAFAAAWHSAIGFAWERVEHRLLAQLLDADVVLDSKLALAAMARRDQGAARVQGRNVDSASVARVRAELRMLTGPDALQELQEPETT